MTATATAPARRELWPALEAISRRIAGMRRPFLFTDFDGTLSPIVSTPGLAALPQEVRTALRGLADAGVVTTVVSGRAMDDLQSRVGLPLIYAGDHGLEIHGGGLEYTEPNAGRLRRELLSVCNRLRAQLSPFSGALVECKRLSASVHFRLVDPGESRMVRNAVESVVGSASGFRLSEGHEVLEIRPKVEWNKGSAARWVLEQLGGQESDAILIGDDVTDEDMFRTLRGGVTVRVGADDASAAEFRLEQTEVLRFLEFVREEIDESRRGGDSAYGCSRQGICQQF